MSQNGNKKESPTRPPEGDGASMVEYALLLASLVLVFVVAARGFSNSASQMFSELTSDVVESGG